MNDYTQPFYVPVGKGRVNLHTGQRGGYYLPALEPKAEEIKPVERPIEREDFRKLHSRMAELENKFYKHEQKKKPKLKKVSLE